MRNSRRASSTQHRSSSRASANTSASSGLVQPGHAKIHGHFSGSVLTSTHHLDVALPISYEVHFEDIKPALTAFADAQKQGNGGIETILEKVWRAFMTEFSAPGQKAAGASPDETMLQGGVTKTQDSILAERDQSRADLEATRFLSGRIEHILQAIPAKVQHFEKERIMEDDDLAGLMHESTRGSIEPNGVQQELQEDNAHSACPAIVLGQKVQEPATVEEYRRQLQALERDSMLEVKRLNELLLRRSSELADERSDRAEQRADAAKLRSKLAALTNFVSSAESSTGRLQRALGRAGLGHARVVTKPALATSQQNQQQEERRQQQPQRHLKLDEFTDDDSAALLTPPGSPLGNYGQGCVRVRKLNLPQDLVADDSAKMLSMNVGTNALHDNALVADLKDLNRWAHNCHRVRKTL